MAHILIVRDGAPDEIPQIVDMVERLHTAARVIVPLHRAYTEAFVRSLMGSPDGLVLVLGEDGRSGMLIASVVRSSVSPAPIAAEHGWWVEPQARGQGGVLLSRYQEWARQKGCFAVKMSTIRWEDKASAILRKEGFAPTEVAWAKVL